MDPTPVPVAVHVRDKLHAWDTVAEACAELAPPEPDGAALNCSLASERWSQGTLQVAFVHLRSPNAFALGKTEIALLIRTAGSKWRRASGESKILYASVASYVADYAVRETRWFAGGAPHGLVWAARIRTREAWRQPSPGTPKADDANESGYLECPIREHELALSLVVEDGAYRIGTWGANEVELAARHNWEREELFPLPKYPRLVLCEESVRCTQCGASHAEAATLCSVK